MDGGKLIMIIENSSSYFASVLCAKDNIWTEKDRRKIANKLKGVT